MVEQRQICERITIYEALFLALALLVFSQLSYAQSKVDSIFHKYGIEQIYDSDVGVYYANSKDFETIQEIDSFVKLKQQSTEVMFQHKLSDKVRFEFYPTHSLAECVCGWDTTTENRSFRPLGCAHYINKIQLVTPGYDSSSDKVYRNWGGPLKVVHHEYIHSYTYDIVGEENINKVPFLIAEGVAVYASQQLYLNDRFKEIVDEKLIKKEVPKFQLLMKNEKFIGISNSYHWAFLFINYLVTYYGWSTVLEIQKDYKKMNQLLNKKDAQINKEWFLYLESIRKKTESLH